MRQTSLFPEAEDGLASRVIRGSSTFVDNMRLPVHRWYRYSAGFSAEWAQREVGNTTIRGERRVLDPFAGSGTTVLAATAAGASSIGVESHPFVARVARTKLLCRSDRKEFERFSRAVLTAAKRRVSPVEGAPELLEKCFHPESLAALDALRLALETCADGSPASELTWLVLVSILRACSHVGTAQWQYVLPNKEKKNHIEPFDAFGAAIRRFAADMSEVSTSARGDGRIVEGDARECAGVPDRFATLVLTSPPYPNNYDYADATRLEMTFLREIEGWGQLQQTVRRHLVRSCTQHVPEKAVDLDAVLSADELTPIRGELEAVCCELAEIRKTKGGRKTYHLMVATYFHDMARTWRALRRVCDSPSRLCFVIGDSAPYGVYVPVADWMSKLAETAGFKPLRFDKLRDRNIKWKNRKHRVPLCEGELWLDG
jgi:hypothetical protein